MLGSLLSLLANSLVESAEKDLNIFASPEVSFPVANRTRH